MSTAVAAAGAVPVPARRPAPASRTGRVAGVQFLVLGDGAPVSVLAHGIAGSAAEVRPVASDVPGTRVLLTFRGHGGSDPLPGGWSYDLLADDLLAVADEVGATRAAGLSLGAGALLRVLQRRPDRFERLAFLLPAALDDQRRDPAVARLELLAAAVHAGDQGAITALLLAELPPEVRDQRLPRLLAARRARELAGSVPPRPITDEPPVTEPDRLRAVDAPALVIGQLADGLHPAATARRLAGMLPAGRYLELPPGGLFWTAAARARDALAAHLA